MATRNNDSPQPEPRRNFVNQRKVAEVTGRNQRTLEKDRLFGNGPFPHYTIGRQVRYDLNEVITIVESTRKGGGQAA